MHSFTDCVMGSILGAGIWWGHSSWAGHPVTLSPTSPVAAVLHSVGVGEFAGSRGFIVHLGKGLGSGAWIDNWARTGGWEVPLILIPLCLLAINQHPQPVDDCPCFEDAIAFGAVVLGAVVGQWGMSRLNLGAGLNGLSLMPGSGWVRDAAGVWMETERTWMDSSVWWTVAVMKMGVGQSTHCYSRHISPFHLHIDNYRHSGDLRLADSSQVGPTFHPPSNVPNSG